MSQIIDNLEVVLLNIASIGAFLHLTDIYRLLPEPENAVQWTASVVVAFTITVLNVLKIRQELRKEKRQKDGRSA